MGRESPPPPPEEPGRNRLGGESSAYLLQHRDNPVHWFAWGPEAFDAARRLDRPVLVSIGYSACHWCHVMAHESFEDPETAALLNRLFVNVKVDREERPDVDQIYMDTVVRLTGHGGWPLTAFCTPDGRPFYAGTYFPPEPRGGMPAFRDVCQRLESAWRSQREEVEKSAERIVSALAEVPRGVAQGLPDGETVVRGARALMQGADRERGGFGSGPKFPTPTSLEALACALDWLPGDEARDVLQHLVDTGQEMARRGLYDHLGGGFHRYCVDGSWTLPHFEKMLYDQGLLLRVYAELWRRTGGVHDDFAWPVLETAAYLEREMRGSEGAFYASQDADSEGAEGRFYVWTPAQVAEVLGGEAPAFCAAYSVSERGNFEGATTHLVDRERAPRERYAAERERLREARSRRVPPATDTKRLAAWNGYAASGLARAGSLLGEPSLVASGARALSAVLLHLCDDRGRLRRSFDGRRARVDAFLDDHAAVLDACLECHRAGAPGDWLGPAGRLADQIEDRFYDPTERDLFLAPADGERLPHRPRSDHDGATPHATGLALLGLLRIAGLAGRSDWEEVARQVIRSHAFLLERAPHAHPTLLRAVGLATRGLAVAVVRGEPGAEDTRALAQRARFVLAPEDAVVVHPPGEAPPEGLDPSWLADREALGGRATAYVCRGHVCSLPIRDPDAFPDRAALASPE